MDGFWTNISKYGEHYPKDKVIFSFDQKAEHRICWLYPWKESKILDRKGWPWHVSKLHLMVCSISGYLGSVKRAVISKIPRSTLAHSRSTCLIWPLLGIKYRYLKMFVFKSNRWNAKYFCILSLISLFSKPKCRRIQTFFVSSHLLIVHTWDSSPLPSNLLRLQCTCCTVSRTSGRPHGSPLVWACQWLSS